MVTTTHDPAMGGRPRLVVALGGSAILEAGQEPGQPVYDLIRGVTTIGSSDDSHVSLAGLDAQQAEVIWNEFDEYVFVQRSTGLESRINGERMGSHPLRTGDRLEMGPWTLTYARDEYADHGRPYGGRQGGEGAVQRPQPPRSVITPAVEPRSADLETIAAEEPRPQS